MSDAGHQPQDLRDVVAVLQCALAILLRHLPEDLRDLVLAELEMGLITAGHPVRRDTIEYAAKFVAEVRRSLDLPGA